MRSRRWNRKGIETILAGLLLVVIVVVMSVIIYTWSLGIFGSILPSPPNGREILTLENQAFNSSSVTLYIRNTGTAVTKLTSYYIQDGNGNQYSRASWTSGPTVSPTNLAASYLPIQPACPPNSCPLTGQSFSFQRGYAYTIVVTTQRNNQFTFTLLY